MLEKEARATNLKQLAFICFLCYNNCTHQRQVSRSYKPDKMSDAKLFGEAATVVVCLIRIHSVRFLPGFLHNLKLSLKETE